MKKSLTLTKEQSRTLYNLLSNHQVPNRSDNRKRFKFLEVFEAYVFAFDDEILKVVKKVKDQKEANEKIKKLGSESKTFIFNDREVFSAVKDMFEKLFEIGAVSRDQMGKTTRTVLVGRDAKIYMEIEDAFADVKDIKEKK